MLLKAKHAVIYGASGAVGSVIARTFAREGAHVHLTGRNAAALNTLAREIVGTGGTAETAIVDALDEGAVEDHMSALVKRYRSIDVSFNCIGIAQPGIQGIPLRELSADSFTLPVTTYAHAHFITAKAAARRMVEQGSGVIMMHTPEPARLGAPLVGGMGPAWAALESLCRSLSAECAQHGVRAVCLRTTGLPETATIDVVFDLHAKAYGITRQQFLGMMEGMTHRKRSTTLEELANVASFIASDQAAAMTGTVANLTGGVTID